MGSLFTLNGVLAAGEIVCLEFAALVEAAVTLDKNLKKKFLFNLLKQSILTKNQLIFLKI